MTGGAVCGEAGTAESGTVGREGSRAPVLLATILLGALIVLVLAAALGWLITRRLPGNRIGLMLVGDAAILTVYDDAAYYRTVVSRRAVDCILQFAERAPDHSGARDSQRINDPFRLHPCKSTALLRMV
jgi:hypothetical protein